MDTTTNLLPEVGGKEYSDTLPLLDESVRPLDTQTYNNCFVLSGICKSDNGKKIKQCYFIKDDNAHKLWTKNAPENIRYRQLTHTEARQTLDDYFQNGKRQSGDETLRVSIWLENAKYGDLSLFCIDFDEYDIESGFFKAAFALADKVTRSQSGGYHMWYGVDREKAEPLFDSINLTTRQGTKSFVCNVTNETDGNTVDLFCENGRLIHEYQEWDNNTGVTDKTESLFELLKASFTFREKASVDYWQDAESRDIQIDGLPEDVLLERMTDTQRIVFSDLMTFSPDCTQREWYRKGVDIKHVFGDELGGSVFLFWSRAGQTFQPESLANTWNDISNRKNALWNSDWSEIIGNEINAFDITTPEQIETRLKAAKERQNQAITPKYSDAEKEELRKQGLIDAQRIVDELKADEAKNDELSRNPKFRGKPIKWVKVERTVKTNNAFCPDETEIDGNNHLIEYEGLRYKREEFLKAMFPEYKKHPCKVRFNNDDVFWLGNNQRSKLQYQILASKFDSDMATVSDEDKADLERFCKNYDSETAGRWYQRMTWEQGHEKMITFGVALDVRRKDGTTRTNGAWCFSADMTDTRAIYTGVYMTWDLWSNQLIGHLDGKRDEHRDNKADNYAAVYKQAAQLMYYQNGRYMTLPAKERKAISDWIYEYYMSERKPPFPLCGAIGGGDRVIEIDFDDVVIVDASGIAGYNRTHNTERNKIHNKEIGRRKVEKNVEQLQGDKWTTQEILSQGFSRAKLDNMVKHGFIRRLKQGHYERNSV